MPIVAAAIPRRAALGALVAGGGALAATPTPAAAGVPAIPATPDRIEAREFGLIGDGLPHFLRDRFTSLAAAKVQFPAARSLDDTVDWAAIQSALDKSAEIKRIVHLPTGRYVLSRSLELDSFVGIVSEGAVLDHQNYPLAMPLIVNRTSSLIFATLSGLVLRGGTHAIRLEIAGESAGLTFDGIHMDLQTVANFECTRLLQTAHFNHCTFDGAPVGLTAGWTTNAVNFFNCNFTNHADASLRLRFAEVVNFFGGRFEGGGREGPQPTLDLEDTRNVNFHGVYFEATHRTLLRERRSSSTTSFEGCHFTGARPGDPPQPYEFDSDGVVVFGTNSWLAISTGPARALVTGNNGSALYRRNGVRYSTLSAQHLAFSGPATTLGSGWTQLATVRLLPGGSGAPMLAAAVELVAEGPLPSVTTGALRVRANGASLTGEATASGTAVNLRLRALSADRLALEAFAADAPGPYRWGVRTLAGSGGDGELAIEPILP